MTWQGNVDLVTMWAVLAILYIQVIVHVLRPLMRAGEGFRRRTLAKVEADRRKRDAEQIADAMGVLR